MSKKFRAVTAFSAIILSLLLLISCGRQPQAPKYVFLFIGDGMGVNQIHAAEMFTGVSLSNSITSRKMAFSEFPVIGLMTNQSDSSFITDSAASGTSLASGYKTRNGKINIDSTNKVHYETISGAAKKKGLKTGVISSVSLDHATPASFYARASHRSTYYEIALQMARSPFDFFGGGSLLHPRGRKKDQPDSVAIMEQNGFKVVTTRDEFQSLQPDGRRIIAFNEIQADSAAMPYEIDRSPDDLPLAAFVRKAIDLLENEQGFFLMAEGGKIDWACHDNDGATAVREVLAFNEAVKEALRFYEEHPDETLIIVTADHETGALGLQSDSATSSTSIALLSYQKKSLEVFSETVLKPYWAEGGVKQGELSDLLPVIEENFGLHILSRGEREQLSREYRDGDKEARRKIELGLSPEEKASLDKAFAAADRRTFEDTVIRILNNKAGLSWAGDSHSAALLPVFAIGRGQESFGGTYDNTDIAKKLAALLGLELGPLPVDSE
jgi:alkaline phosphatase